MKDGKCDDAAGLSGAAMTLLPFRTPMQFLRNVAPHSSASSGKTHLYCNGPVADFDQNQKSAASAAAFRRGNKNRTFGAYSEYPSCAGGKKMVVR
jgi:hypothetical protein